LIVIQSGADNLNFYVESPPPEKIKRKFLLVIRSNPPQKGDAPVPIDASNIEKQIVFMEMNK